MSQHFCDSQFQGQPVVVILGWDRPLACFFMVVEKEGEEDEGIVYSNLNEKDAFKKPLGYFKKKLDDLGIKVPHSMFRQAELDRDNGWNRRCFHDVDGEFGEVW